MCQKERWDREKWKKGKRRRHIEKSTSKRYWKVDEMNHSCLGGTRKPWSGSHLEVEFRSVLMLGWTLRSMREDSGSCREHRYLRQQIIVNTLKKTGQKWTHSGRSFYGPEYIFAHMFHLKLIVHLITFPLPSFNIPAVLKTQCHDFLMVLLRGTSKPELRMGFLPKALTQGTQFSLRTDTLQHLKEPANKSGFSRGHCKVCWL